MKAKKNTIFGNYYLMMKNRRSFITGLKSTKISSKERKFLKKYKPWGVILFSRNIKSLNQIVAWDRFLGPKSKNVRPAPASIFARGSLKLPHAGQQGSRWEP